MNKMRCVAMLAGAAALLPATTCHITDDTRSAIAELAAQTASSATEILVGAWFAHENSTGENVDPDAPISQQQH